MHQKKGKKIRLFFYSLLLTILTSINNYNFNYKNVFQIQYIYVDGFSEKKNELIRNDVDRFYKKNIFFIKKEFFSELINRHDTKYLHVKKKFPNEIFISFTPAKPTCIIEIENNQIILGDNGKVLKSEKNNYSLPYVSGSSDIVKIYYVVDLLIKSNLDYDTIKKIIFFKSGRFDLVLNSGTTIKFPIKFNEKIINYSSNLLKEKKFDSSKIIDLRIENKIIKYE
tara:strand:+ start:1337 stop:2011 length:675 start_codon:yes stop_codon:yes gene_type:complete